MLNIPGCIALHWIRFSGLYFEDHTLFGSVWIDGGGVADRVADTFNHKRAEKGSKRKCIIVGSFTFVQL